MKQVPLYKISFKHNAEDVLSRSVQCQTLPCLYSFCKSYLLSKDSKKLAERISLAFEHTTNKSSIQLRSCTLFCSCPKLSICSRQSKIWDKVFLRELQSFVKSTAYLSHITCVVYVIFLFTNDRTFSFKSTPKKLKKLFVASLFSPTVFAIKLLRGSLRKKYIFVLVFLLLETSGLVLELGPYVM